MWPTGRSREGPKIKSSRWRLGSPAAQREEEDPTTSRISTPRAQFGRNDRSGLVQLVQAGQVLVQVASVGQLVVHRPAHHAASVDDEGGTAGGGGGRGGGGGGPGARG